MSSDPRIIPYLDVPIQHSEDRILSLMGRGHTKAYLRENPDDDAREHARMRCLRTSIIVGFPTETDEEFEDLLSFLGRSSIRYARCIQVCAGKRHAGI